MDAQKKKKILRIIGSIAGVLVLYFAYQGIFYISTDNAQVQGRTVMLSPKVAGYVVKVNVEENQRVKAGDVLVEIDNRDYSNTTSQVENE